MPPAAMALVMGSASMAAAAPGQVVGGSVVVAEGQVNGDPWDSEDPPPAGFKPYCEPILATACEILGSTVGSGLGKPGEIIIKNACKFLSEKYCKYKPPSKEIPPAENVPGSEGCPEGSYPTTNGCEWPSEEPAETETPSGEPAEVETPAEDCQSPYVYSEELKRCEYILN